MTNVVMLGGNGYIGRNTMKEWIKRDPEATFYIVSNSDNNRSHSKRVVNIVADATSYDDVKSKLPDKIDYIVDFVGAASVPKGSDKTLVEINMAPAKVMRRIAEEYHVKAMGAVQGRLGSKEFTASKQKMVDYLKKSQITCEIVNPTLVYGAGRSDTLAKFVPLLKFLGLFSNKFKPVLVTDVAKELVDKMLSH